VLAKRDESTGVLPLPSGTYELRPVMPESSVLAKMDVWRVQIAVIPEG